MGVRIMRTTLTSVLSVIQVATRSSRAYADAAEHFGNAPLATNLREVSDRRLEFATVLMAAIRPTLQPQRFRHPSAHDWGDLSALDRGQRQLLTNLVRSDDAVLFRYSLALSRDLPRAIFQILVDQFAEVGDIRDRIQAAENE